MFLQERDPTIFLKNYNNDKDRKLVTLYNYYIKRDLKQGDYIGKEVFEQITSKWYDT